MSRRERGTALAPRFEISHQIDRTWGIYVTKESVEKYLVSITVFVGGLKYGLTIKELTIYQGCTSVPSRNLWCTELPDRVRNSYKRSRSMSPTLITHFTEWSYGQGHYPILFYCSQYFSESRLTSASHFGS